MRVLISWSGDLSHALARALRNWLPTLIEGLEPWVSSADIEKGSRWGVELADILTTTKVGILCVDISNLQSAWLTFEAGALSRIPGNRVIPVLYGEVELQGPLSQFQAVRWDKQGLHSLVSTINDPQQTPSRQEVLGRKFEYSWSTFADKISAATEPKKSSK